jgi:hypothetical protein
MTQPHRIKFPPAKVFDFLEDTALPVFNALRAVHGIAPAPARIGPAVTAAEARAAWVEWGGYTPQPEPEKPRAPNRFRQRELARVMRVAKPGDRVDVDPISGKISVTIAPGGEPQAATALDKYLAKKAAKNAD